MKRLALFGISLLACALPSIALAANLSVFPGSIALKKGDAVTFYIRIQAQDSINTVGAAVLLPPGLTFLLASDGTVLTQWVERPAYHADDRSVTFAGIIPDGWSGNDTLATVKVAALTDGTYSLAFDPAQTEVYKNDGNATPEPVVFGTVTSTPLTPPFFFGLVLILIVTWLFFKIIRRKVAIKLV